MGYFLPDTVGTVPVPVSKFTGQISIWNLIRIDGALVRRKERLIYTLIMIKKNLGQSDADLRTLVYTVQPLPGSNLSLQRLHWEHPRHNPTWLNFEDPNPAFNFNADSDPQPC